MILRLLKALNPLRGVTAAAKWWLKHCARDLDTKAFIHDLESRAAQRHAKELAGGRRSKEEHKAMNGTVASATGAHANSHLHGSPLKALSENSLKHFANWARYSSQREAWSDSIRDQVRAGWR
jgi:hypothetical protein